MQVLHYGKTGFGTNDWICMQFKKVTYLTGKPVSSEKGILN